MTSPLDFGIVVLKQLIEAVEADETLVGSTLRMTVVTADGAESYSEDVPIGELLGVLGDVVAAFDVLDDNKLTAPPPKLTHLRLIKGQDT